MSINNAPAYVSVKFVQALRIKAIERHGEAAYIHFDDDRFLPITMTAEWVAQRGAAEGGFMILYEDGYTSWSPAEAFMASCTPATIWGIKRTQSAKFGVNRQGRLVRRDNNEAIPDDEPVFILRARDIHALTALHHYLGALPADAANRPGVAKVIDAFSDFALHHPARMSLPTPAPAARPPIPPEPRSINVKWPPVPGERAPWPFPSSKKDPQP